MTKRLHGRVTFEATMWCGAFEAGRAYSIECAQHSQASYGLRPPSIRAIEANYRANGWEHTREFGWVCPACSRAKAGGGGDQP